MFFLSARRNNLGDVSLHVKQAGTIKERCISLIPMKVLDAPGLKDDYCKYPFPFLEFIFILLKLCLKQIF